jgi:hypothetical protein
MTTLTTQDFRKLQADTEAEDAAEQAERDRLADIERERVAERAAAELEKRIDNLKESVPDLSTIHAPLDNLRALIPELQRAVAQRSQAATAAITDAHSITSPRVQVGPNGSFAVIDRDRISTHSREIGTEAAALCAEICRAAGEGYLERACRDRVRGGNRLLKGNHG